MELLVLLAFLTCPLVMGGAMVWMVRQMRRGAVDGDRPPDEGPG